MKEQYEKYSYDVNLNKFTFKPVFRKVKFATPERKA